MSHTALRSRAIPLILWEGSLLGAEIVDTLCKAALLSQHPQNFSTRLYTPTDLLNGMVFAFTEARRFWSIFKSRLDYPDAPICLSTSQIYQL